MVKLLEKTSGYSDCEYLKQLDVLKNVMFRTQSIKTGRGKKAKYHEEYIYNSEGDNEVRETILNSIKHYKEQCLNSENIKQK